MNRADIVRAIRAMRETATDEVALDSIDLYPMWKEGITPAVGARYQHEGTLYRCVQSHTTQADWTPDKTPALWVVVSLEQYPDWVQPTGAHDAYQVGDKVTYQNEHWVCTSANNVYAPNVYGWTKED